ncbi:MAG: S1 RNA-binding domain-containing protein [Bacteroidetes bacterium]|nr:S1 RNA-binding domain-containing protein [Bacteroidota bacterium]
MHLRCTTGAGNVPAEGVSLSQRVKVRVLEVDRVRKRIQLTMKF